METQDMKSRTCGCVDIIRSVGIVLLANMSRRDAGVPRAERIDIAQKMAILGSCKSG
jgi:hypothetical protein